MQAKLIIYLMIVCTISISLAQKKVSIEQRVSNLERTVDSLSLELRYHTQVIHHNDIENHNDIELAKMTSLLALELNRNFTYFGNLFEARPEKKRTRSSQRVFYFYGYHSLSDTKLSLERDKSSFLRAIRTNLKTIRYIVVGQQTEPDTSVVDGWIVYPNRLIIKYYDNNGSSDELIIADTEDNSIKVRIDGVLQEIGWQ